MFPGFPIVLSRFDAYAPHQWPAWQYRPKGAIEALLFHLTLAAIVAVSHFLIGKHVVEMSHLELNFPHHFFSALCPVMSFCVNQHLLLKEISLKRSESCTVLWVKTTDLANVL